jgi:nitrogen regulatory protein PII
MKKVEMVMAPLKIKVVKDALREIGVNKMTVSKIRRSVDQTDYTGYCRGGKYESKYEPIFLAKTKLEIEVVEKDLEKVLGVIEDYTEGVVYGDEKVFVYSLDETMQLGRKARRAAVV